MFDYIKSEDDGSQLDAETIWFILGWLPFILAWGKYNTVFTEWLVQIYCRTGLGCIVYPRPYERKNIKRLWFWKAMMVVAFLLHPAIPACMWFVDIWEKTKWHEATTMVTMGLVALVIESSFVYKIVDFFRPADA